MSYPINITDAGRSLSNRPKARNDCSVRALACATNLPYDEAYEIVAADGRKSGRGHNLRPLLDRSTINGMRFVYEPYPAQRGQPRMNIERFCREKPVGRYVCRVSGHYLAIVDGVVQDDTRTYGTRCIYGAHRAEVV